MHERKGVQRNRIGRIRTKNLRSFILNDTRFTRAKSLAHATFAARGFGLRLRRQLAEPVVRAQPAREGCGHDLKVPLEKSNEWGRMTAVQRDAYHRAYDEENRAFTDAKLEGNAEARSASWQRASDRMLSLLS